jgi:hypothetical protein
VAAVRTQWAIYKAMKDADGLAEREVAGCGGRRTLVMTSRKREREG